MIISYVFHIITLEREMGEKLGDKVGHSVLAIINFYLVKPQHPLLV
jgi:hypothetical protein